MEGINDMSEESKYESRVGIVKHDAKKIYDFASDMRNFNSFIPADTIKNWYATREACSFEVSPLGKANLRICDSEENKMVKYEGDGLNGTNFFLWVQLKEVNSHDTRVKLTIKADLNPLIKVMAQKPINDFLEKIISGIENFDGWDDTSE